MADLLPVVTWALLAQDHLVALAGGHSAAGLASVADAFAARAARAPTTFHVATGPTRERRTTLSGWTLGLAVLLGLEQLLLVRLPPSAVLHQAAPALKRKEWDGGTLLSESLSTTAAQTADGSKKRRGERTREDGEETRSKGAEKSNSSSLGCLL